MNRDLPKKDLRRVLPHPGPARPVPLAGEPYRGMSDAISEALRGPEAALPPAPRDRAPGSLQEGVAELRKTRVGLLAESDCMLGARYVSTLVGGLKAQAGMASPAVRAAMEATGHALAKSRDAEIFGNQEAHQKALEAHVVASALYGRAQEESGRVLSFWARVSRLHADQAKAHAREGQLAEPIRPGRRLGIDGKIFVLRGDARWDEVPEASRFAIQMSVTTRAGVASKHAFGIEASAGGVNHMTYEEHRSAADAHRQAATRNRAAADDPAMKGTPAEANHVALVKIHLHEAEQHDRWAIAKAPNTRDRAIRLQVDLEKLCPKDGIRTPRSPEEPDARLELLVLQEAMSERNWTVLPQFIERAERFLAAQCA